MSLAQMVVVAVLAVCAPVAAAQLRVTVSPLEQVVVAGEVPVFSVRIEAVGGPARIMRLHERDDLRINYARLAVTRAGGPVDLPRFISDPGPVGAKDYVSLDPGESLVFLHRGEPFALSKLSPGSYSAKVTLHPGPGGAAAVESNAVRLTVRSAAISRSCGESPTQAEMNRCAAADHAKVDGELSKVYDDFLSRLAADRKASLADAQRAWARFRDLWCELESSGAKGGSAYPFALNSCLAAMTRARLRQLSALATCEEGDLGCPTWK